MRRSFETHTEQETITAGDELARRLARGSVVALYGDLGSGKTRFIKGICRGLGVTEHVASPTFTILNEYRGNDITIYHFDFYRLKSFVELREIGFEEYVDDDGVCVIEWADRVQALLPLRRLEVRLALGRDMHTRLITIDEMKEESK